MDLLKINAIVGPKINGEMYGRYKVYSKTAEYLSEKVDYNEISYKWPSFRFPFPRRDLLYNLFTYPKIVQKSLEESDLIHFFSQEDTFLLRYLKLDCPTIATCLDTIGLHLPENGTFGKLFTGYSIRSMRKADKIITISEKTKEDLIQYTRIPEEKIKTIYLGVDAKFKILKEEDIQELKNRYDLPENFILYLGSEQSRKNFIFLIKAFYCLKKKYNLKIKLVKAGRSQITEKQRKKTFELINKLNLTKDIIFIDYIPEKDLTTLYNAANLFVYPSLYEGFGLPPLEAMACGTPVITSNTTSLPEVVGEAGIIVDPHNIKELRDAMYNVLKDPELGNELSKKGLKRAKMFSWERTAQETWKVYEDIYNGE